ncbi:MAG: SDR family oxidoreductase [Gammaproteobacteria bacterium]|nr:SDR family oxidoreductase [Gammaproteobacteria bacterium]
MSATDTEAGFLVTGASRGIGRAVAQRLLDEGRHVIGLARRFDDELLSRNQFDAVAIDLAQLDQLPQRLKQLQRAHPLPSGIICAAGQGRFGALEQFSATQIRNLVDLNLTSQILLAREYLPAMKQRGSGTIIFIGSEAALSGGARGAVYSATKFALRGFVQSLRAECSASGVRIGIVNPGMVDSSFFDDLNFRPGGQADQHLTAEDVAHAIALMLAARPGAVIDEINLSPQKRVIDFGDRE